MKILVINNYTKYIDNLLYLLKEHQVIISAPERIKDLTISQFDRVILTGGGIFALRRNEELFTDEITMIKNCNVPLIGICLGSELIAVSFGGVIKRRAKRLKGNKIVTLGKEKMEVFQNHVWDITELSPELISLLNHDSGVLVFRHQTKSIYGFQFHPEINPSSAKLITRFIENPKKVLTTDK